MLRGGEDELVEGDVEPAIEFEASLLDGAGVSETEFLVESDAAVVFGVNDTDEGVVILFGGAGDEAVHQLLSDVAAAMRVVDVNGVFDGVFVSRPGAEGAVAGEAEEQAIVSDRADDGESAFALGLEPRAHVVQRARLVIVKRGGVDDGVVEDIEDGRGVGRFGAVEEIQDL